MAGQERVWYVSNSSISAAAFFFFFFLTKETTEIYERKNQPEVFLPSCEWTPSTFILATKLYFNLVKCRSKSVTKNAFLSYLHLALLLTEIPPPPQEGYFTHSKESGYTNYIWRLIFIKTCFSDCDEGQI